MKTLKQQIISPWAFAVFAAIFVFGFVFIGCGGDDEGPAEVPVSGITLNKATLTLARGATETLIATVSPSNATNKTVTWKSSNVNIASVSSTGLVTGASVSSTPVTITATAGGKSATCTVTVTAVVPITGVALNYNTLNLEVGDGAELTATVSPSTATNKAVTWLSSDNAVATVVAGTVSAKSVGTATITATSVADNTKKAECTVTVTAAIPGAIPVTGVTVAPTTLTMAIAETQTLTATVAPSNATNKVVDWTSSDEDTATVSTAGVVTAKAAGTTTITVTTRNGGFKANCAVTVEAGAADPTKVATITLNYEERTLNVGATLQLTTTVLPATAVNKSVTWSSSNANIATVSNTGLVRAEVPGQVSITATSNADNTKYASCLVTVPGTNVEDVTLNVNELEVLIDETKLLTATVLPTDATVKTVTWTSSDEDVAFVLNAPVTIGSTTYPAGTVVGFDEGEATITVTTKDGRHTAECVVTVKPVPVTGVSVYPPSLTLSVGGSPGLITPTVVPANATNTNVIWTCTPAGIVDVDEFDYLVYQVPGSIGRVTPLAEGTATVTGTAEDGDGAFVAQCTVTVTAAKNIVEHMVWIEPGKFKMGLPSDQDGYTSELPQHEVTLNGFYMSYIAVSQKWYEGVTGKNPSYFAATGTLAWAYGDWPVDGITWYDAIEFCIKLNDANVSKGIEQVYTMTGRTPATGYPITNATVSADYTKNGYRLPTEAEWEYACRAGTTSPYNTGYDFLEIEEDANFDDGSDDAWWQTIPGGPDPDNLEWPWILYPPNNWGLYDMHGNVEEWCWDWFAANYNGAGNDNPTGPASPPQFGNPPVSYKVARGGAFLDEEFDVRSATRNGWQPGQKHSNPVFEYGLPWMSFRVVLPEAGGEKVGTAPVPRKAMSSVPGNTQRMAHSAMKFKSLKSFTAKQLMSSGYAPLNIKGHVVKAKPGTASFNPAMLFNLPGKIEATSPVKPQALRRKAVLE